MWYVVVAGGVVAVVVACLLALSLVCIFSVVADVITVVVCAVAVAAVVVVMLFVFKKTAPSLTSPCFLAFFPSSFCSPCSPSICSVSSGEGIGAEDAECEGDRRDVGGMG